MAWYSGGKMDTDAEKSCDVIVIGAGISGLYAAKCLQDEGLKVVVVEAQDRVGGRTWTYRDGSGLYADMGGAYIGKQQKKLISLATELGLEMFELPKGGKTTMQIKGKTTYFTGDVPQTYNIFELMDLAGIIKKLDSLSRQVSLTAPWTMSSADELDSLSIFEYLDRNCWTDYAKTLVNVGFAAVFAVSTKEISMLYALLLAHSCGGVLALFNGLQEMKLIGGADGISQCLYKNLRDSVKLRQRVCSILQSSDSSPVLITTDDGTVYNAQAVVYAASPSVMKSIKFVPNLPDCIQSFFSLPTEKHYFKTVMYYSKAYWEERGLKGDIVSDEGIVRICFPDTKNDGTHPAIMGFIDGVEYEQMTFEERKASIASHYAKLFGIEAMKTPTGYLEKHWDDPSETRYSGPCVFSLPPGFLTKEKRLWGQTTFGSIFFAGSESAVVFRGYMDGGLRSAEHAVKQLLDKLGRKPRKSYGNPYVEVPYQQVATVERLVPSIPQFLWMVCGSVCVAILAVLYYS